MPYVLLTLPVLAPIVFISLILRYVTQKRLPSCCLYGYSHLITMSVQVTVSTPPVVLYTCKNSENARWIFTKFGIADLQRV